MIDHRVIGSSPTLGVEINLKIKNLKKKKKKRTSEMVEDQVVIENDTV